MAAQYNYPVEHMVVVTVLLKGELKEILYMKQPEGYDNFSGAVLKLNDSLYGLKQASKCLNEEIHKGLKENVLRSWQMNLECKI